MTALVACVLTIAMGVIGRYPFALATGLGLNAFVAFQVASRMSWPAAMGMVVIEGLVITVLVLTGFRVAVFNAIPMQLKSAIAVGIGLFIALIGLVDAGFVRRQEMLRRREAPYPDNLLAAHYHRPAPTLSLGHLASLQEFLDFFGCLGVSWPEAISGAPVAHRERLGQQGFAQ